MDNPHAVNTLVGRLVREARLPGRRQRDELRRELAAHFEDAGAAGDASEEALRRFGDPEQLSAAFRQVYQWDYTLWYLAKVAGSVIASVAVALLIQVVVNLRVELQSEIVRLAPGFSRAAGLSVAVVVGLAAAWEIGRRPFDGRRAALGVAAYIGVCASAQVLFAQGVQAFGPATLLVAVGYACSRLERRPARLLLTFAMFLVAMFAGHSMARIVVDPARAIAASAVLVAIWTSTIGILSRCDHAFLHQFHSPE
jgi:hypothetical protein